MALASKVAIITGGASGLGLATALRFAKHGARVAVIDLASTTRLKEELPSALFCQVDITKEDQVSVTESHRCDAVVVSAGTMFLLVQVSGAIESVLKNYGKLTTVVNCAGIGVAQKVLSKKGPHSLADFRKVVSVVSIVVVAIACHSVHVWRRTGVGSKHGWHVQCVAVGSRENGCRRS
jgi:3-hydroxyacyl-CoA dehydrogenase / 3-hydroxy-2-methylbutyryl-CoA dehydrogenase